MEVALRSAYQAPVDGRSHVPVKDVQAATDPGADLAP